MKLPEPVAYLYVPLETLDGKILPFASIMKRDEPPFNREIINLYGENQVRELLAQQEANMGNSHITQPPECHRLVEFKYPESGGFEPSMGMSHSSEPCHCKDRPASECPGEWEPGCDLGNNEAHAALVNQCDGCMADQIGQLQEQNTYLDKVASELQDTCDSQAVQLRSIGNLCAKQSVTIQGHEAVMRQALGALNKAVGTCFTRFDYHDFESRPDHFCNQAIKSLEEALGTST